jgi:hypothetical protein
LPEFDDRTLLTRFIRADGETVQDAVGVVLIEILMRLDADGVLQLERRRIDEKLETALTERLPVHVPIQLSLALADRDKLWKVVQDQKISLILRTLGKLAPAKEEATPAQLVRADSPVLLPRQGVYVGARTQWRNWRVALRVGAVNSSMFTERPALGRRLFAKRRFDVYSPTIRVWRLCSSSFMRPKTSLGW